MYKYIALPTKLILSPNPLPSYFSRRALDFQTPSGEYRVISIRVILFYLFLWITCSASTISALPGCYPLSIVCLSSSTILVSGAPRHDTFFPSCFMSMCNPLGYDRPALRSRHTFFQPGLKPPYFYHFRTSSPQFLCGPLGFPSCVI